MKKIIKQDLLDLSFFTHWMTQAMGNVNPTLSLIDRKSININNH